MTPKSVRVTGWGMYAPERILTNGDLVSCYLAILYGLDPTPVDAIGLIKQRLAGVDAAAEE